MTHIATGGYHTCALVSGGAQCWGANWAGELGTGDTTAYNTPQSVSGLASGVTQIATGGGYTCALVSGGVRCWGSNWNGQLGTGDTTARGTPQIVALSDGGTASFLSTGDSHSCAVVSGGVQCWGSNWYGKLGDSTIIQRSSPVWVQGLGAGSGVIQVSAHGAHTCALLITGSVKCWGQNYYGQLGDGTTSDSSVPVTVTAATNVQSLVQGPNAWHTCVIATGGSLKCWGMGNSGQLGPMPPVPISNF